MRDYHKLGGINRMNQLTESERKELSRKGVQERLNPTIPKATHSGILQIGDKQIECAVIKDSKGNVTRVVSSNSIMKLMGRKGKANSEIRKKSRGSGLPVFLLANNLQPFIPLEDSRLTTPIIYKNRNGNKTIGYDYSVLTIACEAYLKAKDANVLTIEQVDLAKSCEMLMRSFAQVGLVNLIDEVSRYQEVRDRFALQALLDKHLRFKELLDKIYPIKSAKDVLIT